jgi:hypothetical protein
VWQSLRGCLQEKLTGLPGGIELLCAVGFQARVQDGLASAAAEGRSAALAQAVSLAPLVTTLREYPFPTDCGHLSAVDGRSRQKFARAANIFPLLAPNTLWDIHLEMHEPAIETLTDGAGASVKLSWLDWFDGLTHSKTAIDEALKTM